jgi:hypothetical protein
MPRLSTLSNPTGLIDLEKQRISIVIDDQSARKNYSLVRLDVSGIFFPHDARVIVIARRGNSELRVDHGLVADWNKGLVDASELGIDGTWSFRVLVVARESPMLLAAAENIRPDGLGDSESLIALEPADLGQVPWELLILEQDGRAVIRFNRTLFSNAASADADAHFGCFVFPEAVRQLACWHTQNPGALVEPHWAGFKNWLAMHGITDEPNDEFTPEQNDDWCRNVVIAFSDRFRGVDQLTDTRKKEPNLED